MGPEVPDRGKDSRRDPEFEAIINANYPRCPRCNGFIPNNETPGAYMGAISRRDNKTEICSNCGTNEGLEDFFFKGGK